MLKITARQIVAGMGTGLLAGLLVVAFESEFQGSICEYNQATKHEDCPTYSLFPFLFVKVCKTLNDYGGAITGIATVFLTFITWRLVIVARDQSKTTRRQLRAYLSIELAVGPRQLVPEFKAKITFKNCGQTPAYEGTMQISIAISTPPPDSTAPAICTFEMPPSNTFTAMSKLELSDETIFSFNEGKTAIYISGRADFKDAFDEDRWFTFRFRYDKECVATGNLSTEEIKSN